MSAVGERYAESLFDLAIEENKVDRYLQDMKLVDEVLHSDRKIVQFFYDFIPGGQVMQCMSLEAVNIAALPVYSVIIIVLTTGTGVFFFKKKELK